MSPCTAASSGRACWTPPVPARSSPRRPRPDARGDEGRQRRRRRPARGQELHRRRHELRHGRRHGQGRGHRGRDGPHQRRCRGGGLALHRGPARRGRHRPRREDLRRRRRRRQVAGGGGRARPQGQRQRALDGHGPDSLHHAGVGRAQLRARR